MHFNSRPYFSRAISGYFVSPSLLQYCLYRTNAKFFLHYKTELTEGWGIGALVSQAQDRKRKVGLELTETKP